MSAKEKSLLAVGSEAPGFDLEASTGGRLSSKDLLGKFAVIVFYPRNNTPGWNKQLKGLEQYRPQFEAISTQPLAINSASIPSHQNYAEKFGFGFPILSDPEEKILKAFASQKPAGKGVLRTVYVIDPQGEIIFAKRGHASFEEIIELIKTASM